MTIYAYAVNQQIEKNGQAMIKFNDKYEILTSSGFSTFAGIQKKKLTTGVILYFSNGKIFKCTENHRLLCGNEFIEAKNAKGATINGNIVERIEKDHNAKEYYDILETNNHDYVSSGIISHNCAFEGSLATLVHADYISAMKEKYMIDPVNVLDDKKLRIFAWPLDKKEIEANNYEYLITIDPAMGTGQDYSVANVWLIRSNTNIEQVAIYHSNDVPPDTFVAKIMALCKMYHNPYVIVETMEPAGGIIISGLININNYYNVINMQKEGVGFRMTHEVKIKACTLLQVYFEKQAIKIHDEITYGEIEMFGKKNNTYKAIGDNHDDCVMSTLAMLYYVNSNYFYGNMDEVSIHSKPTTVKADNLLDESDDPLIKDALTRMRTVDEQKGGSGYANNAIIFAPSSKISYEDATKWKEERIPDQKGNPMFNPNANGNSFWYNRNGY